MRRAAVISAIPTIFEDDGRLDLPGTIRCVEHVLDGGVDFVLVNGTTGEFPSLSAEERTSLVHAALHNAGPDKIIAHVGASSAYEAVALTRSAVESGARRIAAITPYFLPASKESLRRYFGEIRSAAGDAELYAYLFPDRTHVYVTVDEMAALVGEFGLAGVKLSIPGVDYVRELVARCARHVAILSGNDRLVVEVDEAGGAGVVSGVSSAVPGVVARVARSVAGGGGPSAEEQAGLNRAVDLLGPSMAALKSALVMQGVIGSACCRMSIDPVTEQQRAAIASLLAPTEGDDEATRVSAMEQASS